MFIVTNIVQNFPSRLNLQINPRRHNSWYFHSLTSLFSQKLSTPLFCVNPFPAWPFSIRRSTTDPHGITVPKTPKTSVPQTPTASKCHRPPRHHSSTAYSVDRNRIPCYNCRALCPKFPPEIRQSKGKICLDTLVCQVLLKRPPLHYSTKGPQTSQELRTHTYDPLLFNRRPSPLESARLESCAATSRRRL